MALRNLGAREMDIALGIGTNIGDRLANLQQAVSSLAEFVIDIEPSAIYESEALLPEGAPDSWNQAFLNMVARGKTNLKPLELLREIKKIEKNIGRQERGFWSPREIDIDILIYGDENVEMRELTIPHQHILNRSFVLFPLNDVWSDWQCNMEGEFRGKSVAEILQLKQFSVQECFLTKHKLSW